MKCGKCGGVIQATVKLWLTLNDSGGWNAVLADDVSEAEVYCENDHDDAGLGRALLVDVSASAEDFVRERMKDVGSSSTH